MIEDEDQYPECPETTEIDPQYLPAEPARLRIARAYRMACAARKAILQGDAGKQDAVVMQFVQDVLKYTNGSLNKRVRGQPYYGDHSELYQDMYLICLNLLDQTRMFEEKPNCCIGTQIYNYSIWSLHRLTQKESGSQMVVEELTEIDEHLLLEDGLENTDRAVYEKQVSQIIANRYGTFSMIWVRGRYHGNSYEQMRKIMGLSYGEATLYESRMSIIHTDMEKLFGSKPKKHTKKKT